MGYRSHTEPIFSKLGIMNFDDLFTYNCCKLMHKIFNEKAPPSFKNVFIQLPAPNRTNSFEIVKNKNEFLLQFPTYFLPKIWNSKPLSLKCIKSHNSFKTTLEENLIDEYATHVKCKSASCPDCH